MTESERFKSPAETIPSSNTDYNEIVDSAVWKSEQRFRLLVDAVQDYAIYMLDTRGHITSWNLGAERLKGYRSSEIIGRHFSIFYTKEDRAAGRPNMLLQKALTDGAVRDEGWRVRKDGTRFWANVVITAVFDPDGNHVGFSKVTRDLSEQRNLLDEREMQLQMAIDAAQMGVWDHDLTTGNVHLWRRTSTLFGLSQDHSDFSFDAFVNLIHPEDRQRFRDAVRESIEKKEDHRVEFRVVWPDGSIHWLVKRGGVVKDAEGAPVRIIGIGMEITDRKNYEQKLIQQAEDLWRSNQELEQFAYVSSHDLQEPLRKISNFADLLKSQYGPKLDENAGRYVDILVNSAIRMRTLIQDLLLYSRLNKEDLPDEQVDLNRVMLQVMNDFEAVIKDKHAKIVLPHLPTIRGKAVEYHQLFQNLVGNALKYNESAVPVVEIGASLKDRTWTLFVKDNGIGIEPQYWDQIFKVFQRLHPASVYPGSGIGLAICKKIVEKRHGKIWVSSEPGAGSTFFFTLPAD